MQARIDTQSPAALTAAAAHDGVTGACSVATAPRGFPARDRAYSARRSTAAHDGAVGARIVATAPRGFPARVRACGAWRGTAAHDGATGARSAAVAPRGFPARVRAYDAHCGTAAQNVATGTRSVAVALRGFSAYVRAYSARCGRGTLALALGAALALCGAACTPRGAAAGAPAVTAAASGAGSAAGTAVASGGRAVAQATPAAKGASQQQLSPEVQKLGRVLSGMSERAKAAIPNGDPQAFLADLHAVLELEKNFRADDVSLYYLIDKKHNIGSSYVPKDLVPVKQNELWNVSRNDLSLRPEAYRALEELSRAALADGIKLMVSSTYRSYSYQDGLFKRYVAQDGLALAERYSARPGTSQHQLGVAVDFGSITDDWGDTKMGKWVYAHAAEHGWSLSFPQGYEDVTGYMWECWHFRYLGKEMCRFQKKWFGDIQQFMLEFIDAWKNAD